MSYGFQSKAGAGLLSAVLFIFCMSGGSAVHAQAVKGKVAADAPPPVLMYHGLVPGRDNGEKAISVLGKPEFEAAWYDYKLYYPTKGRPGLTDTVHMHGSKPSDLLANIESASVPEGYETEAAIRAKLGEPEFHLKMATWQMLDYSEKGLRFGLSPEGKTIGVAYFPHGKVRVPPGERKFIDLSGLRQGPQPKPASPASPNGLKVGVSEIVFSPTGADWLHHPYKIATDLKARTAVFSDGKVTVALCGADLFGMGWDQINVMREAVKKIGVDHLVVGMAHDHEAGDTIGVYGFFPADYVAYIQKQIIAGVTEAYKNMKPVAEVRTASKEMPMDGMRVQYLIRNARNSGILDPTISIIQPIGQDGKPIATIVNYACHVESVKSGAQEITADFPGYMCEQMKADGLGQPIFLNGALGGMVSGDNKERTHESSKETGLKFASIVKDLAKTVQSPATFKFSAERRPVEIPMTNPKFKPLYEGGLRSLHRGRVVTDMIYIQLGEAQIVTLPGELLPEMSYEVLERMTGFPRILVGLANDELGYMIPPYDFRDDEYEETMSQGPATSLIIRDMALRMVQGVK